MRQESGGRGEATTLLAKERGASSAQFTSSTLLAQERRVLCAPAHARPHRQLKGIRMKDGRRDPYAQGTRATAGPGDLSQKSRSSLDTHQAQLHGASSLIRQRSYNVRACTGRHEGGRAWGEWRGGGDVCTGGVSPLSTSSHACLGLHLLWSRLFWPRMLWSLLCEGLGLT